MPKNPRIMLAEVAYEVPTMLVKDLKKVFARLVKIANGKRSIPICDYALLKDNRAHVTNLETSMEIKFPYAGVPALLDVKNMRDILITLDPNDKVGFYSQDKQVVMKVNENVHAASGYYEDPMAFPKHHQVYKDVALEKIHKRFIPLEVDLLKKMIPYNASDELRPMMSGVYLSGDQMVVTDAHRLIHEYIVGEPVEGGVFTKELVALLDPKQGYDMYYNEEGGNFTLVGNEERLYSRGVEGKYPNWRAVVPEDNPIQITVDTKQLIRLLKQALPFANKDTKLIGLKLSHGMLEITSKDKDFPEKGEFKTKIEANYGDGIEIGFNCRFLISILDYQVKTGHINTVIKMSAPNRSALFNSNGLLMPVMLNR